MNWIDSIKEIQRAAENNRLVVFVGSGVSVNSNIPTWGALITQLAKEIGYDNCSKCSERTPECPRDDCDCRYRFSQDEFLRIPEYCYLQDDTENKQGYYDLIRNTLACDTGANSIDDVIFRILPHHIITTNYDPLLERSKEVNARFYSVISQDKDILSRNNTRYIIKMHGDLETPKSIILKESDYIDYEQTHTLISTFIKSLLIDHTFLFIGYSLNDYNLKLIIGWINYFARVHGIANRPHNFIVQAENASEHEQVRLATNNIFVVNTSDIPEDILEKIAVPSDLNDLRGKMLYAYLNCIYDSKTYYHYISLSDVLYEKYGVLNVYNKISYEDLIKTYPLSRTEFKGQTLCLWDEEWYTKIAEVLSGESEKDKFILSTFQKAGLCEIYCPHSDKRMTLEPVEDKNQELFKLYLDNRYYELVAKLHDCSNLSAKVYYYHLLQVNLPELDELLLKIEQLVLDGDYIVMLIYKMNCRLLKLKPWANDEASTKEIERILSTVPPKYKNAIVYIEKIFHSMDANHASMKRLLRKQEANFSYNNSTMYFEHSFDKIWSLQAYAYDYYFFFKENFLLVDFFSNPKTYFSYYLRAVLCSYSPVNQSSASVFWKIKNHLEPYPLGEIEIDMLVKYTNSKELLAWIKQYKVQNLATDEGINIASKFVSYCKCFSTFENIYWADQLLCFVILLSKLSFCIPELDEMSKAFVELILAIAKKHAPKICNIFPAIKLFVSDVMTADQKDFMNKILSVLTEPPISSAVLERHESSFNRILSLLAPYASTDVHRLICDEIASIDDENSKCRKIFTFRKIIPMQAYKQYLEEHIANIRGEHLFYFVIEDYLPYSESVLESYIWIISEEVASRKAQPNSRSYPDHLAESIANCILLKLLGKPVDISKLEPYKMYSEYLEFLLSPQTFDYSKVDTGDYMWCNIFHHDEYASFFKTHKKEILTDNLEKTFSNGFTSTDQQKIVYGLLLDRDQLWGYPKQ